MTIEEPNGKEKDKNMKPSLFRRFFNREDFNFLKPPLDKIKKWARKLKYQVKKIAIYCHEATEVAIEETINWIRVTQNKFIRLIKSKKTWRFTFSLFLISYTIYLVIDMLFVVQVGTSAAIMRLGRYNRTVTPGLNIKIPIIEQIFIVNTENLLQEDFGFRMIPPPPPPVMPIEEEVEEVQQQKAISSHELANDGSIGGQLQRTPPLPKDYEEQQLKANQPPLNPQEEAQAREEKMELEQEAEEMLKTPPGEKPKFGKVPFPSEMRMLTGNLNIIDITWSVQYEISDAARYLFRSENVVQNIRDASLAGMRTAVGDRLDNEILSIGRHAVAQEAKQIIQDTLNLYGVGIKIIDVIILDANPPETVKFSFHNVNKSKQEMENIIHQAEAEYNKIIPQAHGRALRIINEAKSYATNLTNRSVGEANRFSKIAEQYQKSKDVTKDRLYIEAMEEIFSNTPVTLVDENLQGLIPLLSGKSEGAKNSSNEILEKIIQDLYKGIAPHTIPQFGANANAQAHMPMPQAGTQNMGQHMGPNQVASPYPYPSYPTQAHGQQMHQQAHGQAVQVNQQPANQPHMIP